MLKQRTLRNRIKAEGIGLHTGKNITMELLPAEINSGISFIRTDVDDNLLIPAIAENVGDTSLSTALIKDGTKISTIEHLLSAIAGLGVDNCLVKVNGPEVPIMDGSSSPFVFLIQSAGLKDQEALKKFIKVKKEITVTRDDAFASIKPYDGFKVSFRVDFDHPVHKTLPTESIIDFSSTSFVKEVCRATIGSVGNSSHQKATIGKAGRNRWKGRRPRVRGVAMNPVDHPMGGGEGRTSGGGHPSSPWGQLSEGFPTRKKSKLSNSQILVRRNGRRVK